MAISERALRQWRKDSLQMKEPPNLDSFENPDPVTVVKARHWTELHERILRLTQELMDNYLINKGV